MDNNTQHKYYADQAYETRMQTRRILIALKYIVRVFIYLPLLTIGYFIAGLILTRNDSGLVWLATILFTAFLAYVGLLRIKSILINLKGRNNPFWVILFIVCISVTCFMVPLIAYDPVSNLFARWAWPHWFTWAVLVLIASATYDRYDFLGHSRK